MKLLVGDLIRNKRESGAGYPLQIFDNIDTNWLGVVTKIVAKNTKTKYNHIEVYITYPKGMMRKTWLTDREVSRCIEVLK